MQQTQADKKAARDGFKFVVIRQGRRIAYTTTLAEAKRECGKAGKVVAISGMRYTAKNPMMPFGFDSFEEHTPSKSETKAQDREMKLRRSTTVAVGNWYGKPAYLYVRGSSSVVIGHMEGGHLTVITVLGDYATLKEAKAALKGFAAKLLRGDGSPLSRNPSSGAKQRARGTRSYGKGLFVEADLSGRHARMLDKAAGIRRKSAMLGPTYTKLMHRDALAEAARVRNPSEPLYNLVKYEIYSGFGSSEPKKVFTGTKTECYLHAKSLGLTYDPTPRGVPQWHYGRYMYELRKTRSKKANPSGFPVSNPSFSKWLDTFLEEKEIDMEEVLTVKGKAWGTNYIPVGAVVRAMKMAPKHEQEAIKTMLVKIDFRNAPVRPYLAHLAQAIAH